MVFYASIVTLYRTVLGVSFFQITLIESISLILCLLLEIPWGMIADKIGYKRTMLFCCGLYFVSKIIFWQATGFKYFLLERILLSIVISGLSGVDTSILYLSCKKGDSQKVFGIYNSLGTVGLLVSGIVFSVIIKDNYKLAGFLTVISYGLAFIMALQLIEVKKNQQLEVNSDNLKEKFNLNAFKDKIRNIIKNRRVLVLMFVVVILSETCHVITVFLNQLKYESCGLTTSAIGSVYIIATVVSLCGIFSASATKLLGEKRTGKLLFVLVGAACFILAFTEKSYIFIVGVLILQIVNSIFQPLQLELQNKEITTDDRATMLSIYAMLMDCIGISINLVIGYLTEISLNIAFILGSVLCFIGMYLFVYLL